MFRDFRGANSVGLTSGDRCQFGADIVGGSTGVSLSAVSATGFTVAANACNPLTVKLDLCARTTAYNANRLNPWQFTFS